MFRNQTDQPTFGLEFTSAPIYPQTVVSNRPNDIVEVVADPSAGLPGDEECLAIADSGLFRRSVIRYGRPAAMGGLAGVVLAGLGASGLSLGFDIRLTGLLIGGVVGTLLSVMR